MNVLYKTVHRFARMFGMRRLEQWTYTRWMRWWLDRDPILGYWRFAAEYLGKDEIPREIDA